MRDHGRAFYCETCTRWTLPAEPTGDPQCSRCGEQYQCGECGSPINQHGACTRPECPES